MPVQIWRADLDNAYITVPVGVQVLEVEIYRDDSARASYAYRFRMFVDCKCVAEEKRPHDDIELVVLRPRVSGPKRESLALRAAVATYPRESQYWFRCEAWIHDTAIPGRWLDLKGQSWDPYTP
jgi:hypothetical protein